ncbi:uncharacterized protein LOC143902829 [Temnothorax americanus]|uniref:uncharacterized protein LOC143902829 n=1 Tax=Temnothorax americanus TaxID=1964332 RepID=UPI0040681D15
MENDNEDCDDVFEDDVKDDDKDDLEILPDLIELIKYVQENPLLWNKTHPQFKNRNMKDLKWILIGGRLTNQLSGEEAKKRFNNLRTTFGKLHKKVCNSESRSGAGGNHQLFKPDWPVYEHMLFLRDVIRPRKTRTSGVRKIEENFMQPKIPKRRKIITKTTAQPIFNSAPPTNSAVPLLNVPCIKDSVCESENNINTSQNLPLEEPIVPDEILFIPENVCSQSCKLENDSWTGTS